ncbi:hypothetical protein EHP00_336 [Ecytonucleospora hepatopenaei]|uniref:Mitochondrial import inner membrane translocase subunit TIM22 n=1 Tax=Ecytonucleospora hepatopenaei TaxID=646526 RepID=A0A1W0E741_9MICR|nr:hypothetical protein EHP00_336 [Ecytonucleospora hepatopenaei]
MKDNKKEFIKNLKTFPKKLFSDALKGYVFGSIFGVFVGEKKSILDNMHCTGKTFAKMSAIYSTTEFALENIQGTKDAYTAAIAGSTAGAFCNKNHRLFGSVVFGAYAGLTEYLSEDNKI